jgi:hypothetical protein
MREEEAMQARRAISGCSGREEETPWTKRTVSGYGCIGGEEEVPWVKRIGGSCNGEQEARLWRRARMRVEEKAAGARAKEIIGCHPRWRGLPDGKRRGEDRRLGEDKDGERRWLIGNGDFKKIYLLSHGLTHAQPRLSSWQVSIFSKTGTYNSTIIVASIIGINFF